MATYSTFVRALRFNQISLWQELDVCRPGCIASYHLQSDISTCQANNMRVVRFIALKRPLRAGIESSPIRENTMECPEAQREVFQRQSMAIS